jgi:Mn-dependent DtxR family transcriptional regulator
MTESQQKYLEAIRAISIDNGGARPIINDIARYMGYRVNAAHEAVNRLEKAGLVRRYRIAGKCRGVEVV